MERFRCHFLQLPSYRLPFTAVYYLSRDSIRAQGPVFFCCGENVRALVWSPRLPCALFLPLHSRLGRPSRVAQLPLRTSSPVPVRFPGYGYVSDGRRLQVGATHSSIAIVIRQGVLSDPLLGLRFPNTCGQFSWRLSRVTPVAFSTSRLPMETSTVSPRVLYPRRYQVLVGAPLSVSRLGRPRRSVPNL